MSQRFADTIGPSERTFVAQIASFSEPVFLVAILTILALLVMAILRFGFDKRPYPPAALRALGLPIGALLWVLLAVLLAASVDAPPGYWGEALTSLPSLFGYAGAFGFALLAWRLAILDAGLPLRDARLARLAAPGLRGALALVGGLAFLLVVRLVRDAGWRDSWVALLVFFGWVGMALTLLPPIWKSSRRFAIAGAVLALVFAGAFIVPLADRWAWLRELSAEPGGFVVVDPFMREVVAALVPSIVLAALPLLLIVWRTLYRLAAAAPAPEAPAAERSRSKLQRAARWLVTWIARGIARSSARPRSSAAWRSSAWS